MQFRSSKLTDLFVPYSYSTLLVISGFQKPNQIQQTPLHANYTKRFHEGQNTSLTAMFCREMNGSPLKSIIACNMFRQTPHTCSDLMSMRFQESLLIAGNHVLCAWDCSEQLVDSDVLFPCIIYLLHMFS